MKLFNIFFKRKTKAPNKTLEHGLNNNQAEEQIKCPNFIVSTSNLQPLQKADLISGLSSIYCLVGNIVEERFNKSGQKTFKGTKHFSPGTKVYCYPPQWGDGYKQIKVIGKRRNSHRLITVIIMHQNAYLHSTENHKESLLSLAASLNHK